MNETDTAEYQIRLLRKAIENEDWSAMKSLMDEGIDWRQLPEPTLEEFSRLYGKILELHREGLKKHGF